MNTQACFFNENIRTSSFFVHTKFWPKLVCTQLSSYVRISVWWIMWLWKIAISWMMCACVCVYMCVSMCIILFIYIFIWGWASVMNSVVTYIAIQSCFSLCQVKVCLEKKLIFFVTHWMLCSPRKCGWCNYQSILQITFF